MSSPSVAMCVLIRSGMGLVAPRHHRSDPAGMPLRTRPSFGRRVAVVIVTLAVYRLSSYLIVVASMTHHLPRHHRGLHLHLAPGTPAAGYAGEDGAPFAIDVHASRSSSSRTEAVVVAALVVFRPLFHIILIIIRRCLVGLASQSSPVP